MKPEYSQRPEHPPLLESMEICIAALLMAGTWLTWYIAHNRYHLTSGQIEEVAAYAALILISTGCGTSLLITRRPRREKEWPHPPMVVSPKRDERLSKQAWSRDAVVLGYDVHGEPWLWRQENRHTWTSCNDSNLPSTQPARWKSMRMRCQATIDFICR